MMCNKVNNVHVIFSNSELQTHNGKPSPQRLLQDVKAKKVPKKVLQGLFPSQWLPHGFRCLAE